MKLYVARHGQTLWNLENKVCGATNLPLNEKGHEQAKQLAETAAQYDLDIIIASPMKRAAATAQTVSERCGIPCILDPRLFEMDFGSYEGVDRGDPDFEMRKKNFAYRFPDGESFFQVVHRIYSLLDEIRLRYRGKRVLLVCHGMVCRVIHSYFVDMDNDALLDYRLENCQIEEYEL